MLFDYDMLMNLSNINTLDNTSLVNAKEGLIRGNMFEKEYKPYKNYNPKRLEIKNENDELLLKLYETYFAIVDLNLYLDLNPNDNKIYEIYKSYINNYEDIKNMYESKYGPLEITCVDSQSYNWTHNPWPWDGGKQNV